MFQYNKQADELNSIYFFFSVFKLNLKWDVYQ